MKILLLLLLLPLVGCASYIAGQHYPNLSSEQINQLDKVGHSLIGCFMIGGPPVGGRTTQLIIPRTAHGTLTFTPDCQIQGSTLEVGSGQ